jgi:diguanylate cyclase (GGDEF)-like protein
VAAVIVGGATAMLLMVESAGFIIRYVATLLLSIGIMNVILHVINELQTELLRQTTVDPLTGSYNRRHMQSCLATIAAQSKRSSHPAAVLILDIDHFKQINDRFGHPAGDAVLVKVVEVIKNRIRRNDYLFRIGGEEFLVLLPETTTEDALKVAEDLRQAVEASKLLEAECVTISLGVCGYEHAEPVDTWIANADTALYQAKKEGRNKVVRFRQANPAAGRAEKVAESEFA